MLNIIQTNTRLSSTTFFKKNIRQTEVNSLDFCRLYSAIILKSGDRGELDSWVIWNRADAQGVACPPTIGLISEIVQFSGSKEDQIGIASFLTVQRAITGERHLFYGMRKLELVEEYVRVKPQVPQLIPNLFGLHIHIYARMFYLLSMYSMTAMSISAR